MKLLLLGCTGFIGRELVPLLAAAGHQLTLVSRRGNPAADFIRCNPALAESWQP